MEGVKELSEEENDFITIEDEEVFGKIKIHIHKDALAAGFENDIQNVKDTWTQVKENLENERKEDQEKLVANDILELAIRVFDKKDVRHQVVVDISEIDAWTIYPQNPIGWCPAQVQGIGVGNVGFFVSLEAITKKLAAKLIKMKAQDRAENLALFIESLEKDPKLKPAQKAALKDMLQAIIQQL